jgi:putative transposase
VNHTKLYRIYRAAGLSIRRKKRKHCVRVGQPLRSWTGANQEWALDFVHDAVECGRTIRVLSVVDAYTRECLALEVDTSFASRRVTRVLDAIVAKRGQPLRQRSGVDQSAFSGVVHRAADRVDTNSARKTDAESACRELSWTLAEECLAVSWFQNLFDARRKIAAWQKEYNEERPHSSLGYRTPKEFATSLTAAEAGSTLLAAPSSAANPKAETVV